MSNKSIDKLAAGVTHTPGPWHMDTIKGFPTAIGVGLEPESGARAIAILSRDSHSSKEHQEANARLIAAAPELLEACTAALDRLSVIPTFSPDRKAIALLQAAIAKAEGH